MTADLRSHRCCFCNDLKHPGDCIACPEHRARIDAEPMPWDGDAAQWDADHPGGAIDADELVSVLPLAD